MTLLLVPVADALPAVQAHLARWPADELPSPAELAELVALTARYVRASERGVVGLRGGCWWEAGEELGFYRLEEIIAMGTRLVSPLIVRLGDERIGT